MNGQIPIEADASEESQLYWKCPHCGHDDNWFDRSIHLHADGFEEGPFIRCCKCGKADDDDVLPDGQENDTVTLESLAPKATSKITSDAAPEHRPPNRIDFHGNV